MDYKVFLVLIILKLPISLLTPLLMYNSLYAA